MAGSWRDYRSLVIGDRRFRWRCSYTWFGEVLTPAYASDGDAWTPDRLLIRPEDGPHRLLTVSWPACQGPTLKPGLVRGYIEEALRRGWPDERGALKLTGTADESTAPPDEGMPCGPTERMVNLILSRGTQTMPTNNKTVLETANAAITRGDHEGFLAHCTEDTEWVFVGERTLRGKEAVRRWMAETYTAPPTFAVSDLIAEGDHVVAIGTITTKNAAGEPVPSRYCDVWRFRDGKLAGLRAFVVATATATG